MPEQVKRHNSWRKIIIIIVIIIIIILMYRASFIIFYSNKQTHNQYRNSIYHNSLSVQSTLPHVSTQSCHHQTVYSQCLAKLHTYHMKKPFVLEPAARTPLQPN